MVSAISSKKPPSDRGFRVLSADDLRNFEARGYLVVPGVLDLESDIPALEDEYLEVLEGEIDALHTAGRISSKYDELPFLQRFAKAICEGGMSHQPFDICLPPKFDRNTPIHLGPEVFHRILRNPRILDVVEDLIGPEIYSNPVQHTRIKPPQREIGVNDGHPLIAETPWHQDMGVTSEEADGSEIITVWLAVTEATLENSCLVVIPESHRAGLARHCPGGKAGSKHRPVGIPDGRLDGSKALPLPVAAGTAIIFHKKTVHSALPNKTDTIRWSFDLRYNPTGQPTGRSWYPGFVARSRSHPESELRDAEMWAARWRETIVNLTPDGTCDRSFTRWSSEHPACA